MSKTIEELKDEFNDLLDSDPDFDYRDTRDGFKEWLSDNECERQRKIAIDNEQPHELCIKIFYSEANNGYQYDIYENSEPGEDEESVDGGLCTGLVSDAIDMASDQAKACFK